jgi:hypothetical protein
MFMYRLDARLPVQLREVGPKHDFFATDCIGELDELLLDISQKINGRDD